MNELKKNIFLSAAHLAKENGEETANLWKVIVVIIIINIFSTEIRPF